MKFGEHQMQTYQDIVFISSKYTIIAEIEEL